jgi:hypothetical protein
MFTGHGQGSGARRSFVLAVVFAIAVSVVPPVAPAGAPSGGLAGVALADDDNHAGGNVGVGEQRDPHAGHDQYRTEGEIVAKRCSCEGEQVVIVNLDGRVTVEMRSDSGEVRCRHVHVGDYLTVERGLKLSEHHYVGNAFTLRHAEDEDEHHDEDEDEDGHAHDQFDEVGVELAVGKSAELSTRDRAIVLAIPGTSVKQPGTIALRPVDHDAVAEPPGAELYLFELAAVDCGAGPTLADLQGPANLAVIYTDRALGSLAEARLGFARYDLGAKRWVPLPSAPDPAANRVSATISNLGIYAVYQRP